MGRFETAWLTRTENLAALAGLPGRWIDKVHQRRNAGSLIKAVWRRVLRAPRIVMIWFMLAFVQAFILLALLIQRIASRLAVRCIPGRNGVNYLSLQRRLPHKPWPWFSDEILVGM